jgi:hypothetical protein
VRLECPSSGPLLVIRWRGRSVQEGLDPLQPRLHLLLIFFIGLDPDELEEASQQRKLDRQLPEHGPGRLAPPRSPRHCVDRITQQPIDGSLFADSGLDPTKLSRDEIVRFPTTTKDAHRDDPDAFVRPVLRTTTGTTGRPT